MEYMGNKNTHITYLERNAWLEEVTVLDRLIPQ